MNQSSYYVDFNCEDETHANIGWKMKEKKLNTM